MKFLVIPAYEPDEKLIKLLKEVSALNLFQIIVVNDGSGDKFNVAKEYAILLSHGINKGKGAALKTAFTYIKNLNTDGIIVTADSDGQHKVSDIVKVEILLFAEVSASSSQYLQTVSWLRA